MTVLELEKRLANGDLHGIYLFYGENSFMQNTYLRKIKKTFPELIQGINYITISENNIEELISDLETPAFGYEKKLIIVKNSLLFKKEAKTKKTNLTTVQKKIQEYIENNIEEINLANLLVFCEDTVEKNEIYQIIEKLGNTISFENLKGIELERKIVSICNGYGVKIEGQALKNFIELVRQ